VLDRLLLGDTEQQAAKALGLGNEALHSHVKRIYRRLGVSSRPELMLLFLRPWAAGDGPSAEAGPAYHVEHLVAQTLTVRGTFDVSAANVGDGGDKGLTPRQAAATGGAAATALVIGLLLASGVAPLDRAPTTTVGAAATEPMSPERSPEVATTLSPDRSWQAITTVFAGRRYRIATDGPVELRLDADADADRPEEPGDADEPSGGGVLFVRPSKDGAVEFEIEDLGPAPQ